VPTWRLTDEQRRAWLDGLVAGGTRVVAPTSGGGLRLFRTVGEAGEADLDGGKARWSPKEFVFPSTETLFSYRLERSEVVLNGDGRAVEEQVLFGVTPCDAAGLARLDDVFLGEQTDARYAERRARTTVVSLACAEAGPECFCTAVGGSPAGEEGSDLQLVRLDDAGSTGGEAAGARLEGRAAEGGPGDWLVKALTEKGEQLVAGASAGWTAAADTDLEAAERQSEEVEASIARNPAAADTAQVLAGAFGHPLWEAVGERCLGCGVCAYVCPSCSCFDVVDEEGSAACGSRCRFWDSCGFATFTKHASGHNPRATQPARYRQRVLHKFAYFPLEHEDRFMCVGCGRCTLLCPVGIDISRAVERIVEAAAEEVA
jgi:ferredoxin